MKLFLLTLGVISFYGAAPVSAQKVDNADFSHGKSGWQGDGKVVHVAADGTVSDKETPGSKAALRIDLSKTEWKEVKQRLSAKAAENEIKLDVDVMADSTFERLPESKKYTSSFAEGGQYVWSVLAYPKCDFLILVKDDVWYYRPLSLMPAGKWKSFTAAFPNLKERQREISLLLPPGKGFVLIKGK